MYFYLAILALVIIFAIYLYRNLDKKPVYDSLKGKHVVVTGGSSGIGLAVAVRAAQVGAHVTVIGRDEHRLKLSVYEVSKHCRLFSGQQVQYVILDVTSNYDKIEYELTRLEAKIGPIFMLVNCAGKCICGQFDKMDVKDIKQMIDLNYIGTAYPTRYVLPGMKERNEGSIVFVSSEAALIGIFGYSAYSAGKWAVRGLAEAVFMELIGTNVSLTLAFPPDTDTPGYKVEEITKPIETKLISGSGGLHKAEDVGNKMLSDAMKGKKYSVYGLSGYLLSLMYCGTIDSVVQVLLQVFLVNIIKAITVSVQISFSKIVRQCKKEREAAEQQEKDN